MVWHFHVNMLMMKSKVCYHFFIFITISCLFFLIKISSFLGSQHPKEEQPLESQPRKLSPRDDDAEIYGEELKEQFEAYEQPAWRAPLDFEPAIRGVDDVFKDDEENAEKYASTAEQDDVIFVDGIGGNLSRIE